MSSRDQTVTPAAAGVADPGGREAQADLILRELDALPTLASAATRLLAITSADDADLAEVIRLIETDPAMTAKVLSLCSRAALGVAQPVTTVSRAVVLLGLEAVRSAVLSVQVVEWMRRVGQAGERRAAAGGDGALAFDAPGYWRHSIAVACAAELIARAHPGLRVPPGDAFVAGLVHDLGKPALALALPRAYGRVVELAAHRQANIADLEREILAIDHHTAGKRLAERWGLPEALRDAIWLHGQRQAALPDTPARPLIAVVGAADALCRRLHLGWSGNHQMTPELGALCDESSLVESKVEGVAADLARNLGERCEALGLSSEPGERVLLESVLAANRQLGRLARVMEERSRAAGRRARVLTAIDEFLRGAPLQDPAGPVAALEAVVESAAGLLGPGFYAAVTQPKAGGPWLLIRFAPDGAAASHDWLEPPTGSNGQRAGLNGLAATIGAPGATVGLGAWLAGQVGGEAGTGASGGGGVCGAEGGGGADLRMVPLRSAGGSTVAVLVHDRAGAEAELAREIAPLVAAWAAAVSGAMAHERTRTLSEQLAASHRELAQTQQRLAEVQSMARLGELTAGAAHEMNNPLAVISARAQSLASRLPEGAERSAADAIVVAANRLSNLVTQLHTIAHPPRPRPEPVSLQDLLSLVVRDAKERTGDRAVRTPVASVKVVIAAPVPPIRADRELLRRALVELVANALESGSRDPVEVRVEPDPPPSSEPGQRLLIRVVDTGSGMSAHALTHAFDPFFSEKPAGRQPGLGLPTARRLIELHGGTVTLASTPGDGTTATVELRDWRWQDVPDQRLAA